MRTRYARVGARANVPIASLKEPGTAEASKPEGTTVVTLKLAEQGIFLQNSFLTELDAALGTDLHTGDNVTMDAPLDVDVDLAPGNHINRGLIIALGLDDVIPADIDPSTLRDTDFNVTVNLF